MANQQYRVSVPLRGVAVEARDIVTIPEGANLSVVGRSEGQHLVTVRWAGRALLIFEQDLFERTVECNGSRPE